MRKFLLPCLILISAGFAVKTRPPRRSENLGWAELAMSAAGSGLAGAVSWGGYLLWGWGSKTITPDSWDATLEIIGQVGLYGLGYGLLIPAGASTGVISVGMGAGDIRPGWGALIGGYVGSAASVPFAVMALDEPTWARAGLAAGSILVLPPLCAWAGYRLTPVPRDDEGASLGSRLNPYVTTYGERVSVGVSWRF